MNSGIFLGADGNPCIYYDQKLPAPLKYVEVSLETFQVAFVYDLAEISGKMLEYPLDYNVFEMMKRRGAVFVARVFQSKILEFGEFPVQVVEKSVLQ